jgi:hypothetical protein
MKIINRKKKTIKYIFFEKDIVDLTSIDVLWKYLAITKKKSIRIPCRFPCQTVESSVIINKKNKNQEL